MSSIMDSYMRQEYMAQPSIEMAFINEYNLMSPKERATLYERDVLRHARYLMSKFKSKIDIDAEDSPEEAEAQLARYLQQERWKLLSDQEKAASILVEQLSKDISDGVRKIGEVTIQAVNIIAKSNYEIACSIQEHAKFVFAGLNQYAEEFRRSKEIEEYRKLLEEIEYFDKELMNLKKFKHFYSNVTMPDTLQVSLNEEQKRFLYRIFCGEDLKNFFVLCKHELKHPMDVLERLLSECEERKVILRLTESSNGTVRVNITIPELGITIPKSRCTNEVIVIRKLWYEKSGSVKTQSDDFGFDFSINGQIQELKVDPSSPYQCENFIEATERCKKDNIPFVHNIRAWVCKKNLKYLLHIAARDIAELKSYRLNIQESNIIDAYIDDLNFAIIKSSIQNYYVQLRSAVKKYRMDQYLDENTD